VWSQNNKIIIISPGGYEKKFNNHPTPMKFKWGSKLESEIWFDESMKYL
jgi:hypothetical protein